MMSHADIEYWRNLSWPAAPNSDDVNVYKKYCHGRTLLLGSTRLLLPLASEAWDLNPKYSDIKIKNKDWFSLNEYFDTILLDGGLAYGKDFCDSLIKLVLPNCNTFVVRAFLNPNWPTKYAVYFPRADELTPKPVEHPVNNIYTFYIWNT